MDRTAFKSEVIGRAGCRSASVWVGLGVSLVSLALVFRGVNTGAVIAALSRTSLPLLLVAFAAAMAATGGTVLRWKLLLRPYPVQATRLFPVFMIAHLLNVVLPAKLGTVARAYLAGEAEGIDKVFVMGSIAVEKVLDNLIIVLLGVMLLPFTLPPAWLWQPGLSAAALGAMLFLLVVLAGQHRDELVAWSQSVWGKVPYSGLLNPITYLRPALESFAALGRRDIRWSLWGWSILIWACGILANQLTMMAMGVDAPVLAAIFVLIVLQIGTKVPALPGNIGVFHYLVVLSLSVFSIERNVALSYGLVLHGVVVLLPSVLGAFYLWRESYS